MALCRWRSFWAKFWISARSASGRILMMEMVFSSVVIIEILSLNDHICGFCFYYIISFHIADRNGFLLIYHIFRKWSIFSSHHVARETCDLMTLVVTKLGEQVYNGDQEDEGYDLLRFLSAVLYQHERGSRETLSDYIDFSKNKELWKEAEHVSGLGETIFKQGIREGIEQGREEGLEQGREEGKSNGKAEGILDLLEEYGEIPDLLRQRILSEQDLDQLGRWLKLAARSDSIEEFQKKM